MNIQRIKVVLLCDYAFDMPLFTGSNIYEKELVDHLSEMNDIELNIITIGKSNETFQSNNLRIHMIKKPSLLSIPFFHPIMLWKMKQKVIEIDPDIVHAISSGYIYSTVAASLRMRYITILTMYGIARKEVKYYRYDYGISYYYFSIFHILNEKYVISKIPNIIVDSVSIKKLISKWTKSKIYVIPAGVDFKYIKKIQMNLMTHPSPDIFFINNLIMLKGADILIEAISKVKNIKPNISLHIAGIGPRETELKILVSKLNLEENVKFLGFISNEDKYLYYKACKIVVVPSRWDCQPAALFDAAASGKPAIVSDASNPGIIIDGVHGFIYESNDIDELATKISILLFDNDLRLRMGIAAERDVSKYDWIKVAERYVIIYKDLFSHEKHSKIKN